MVLYAAEPDTPIIAAVIIALGSIAYFCSIFEIIVGGFLVRELRLERENQIPVAQVANAE